MFGWRKKQDGFEWHDYVRTTILVRRAKRREKVDDARQAAVDGLKDAGAAAAQGLHNAKGAAADGLRRAGRKGQELGASGASGLVGLALLALINLKRLSRRFAQALKVGWLKISTDGVDLAATLAMPLLSHLADRRTRIIVGAVGIAATIAFAYRTFSFGLDTRAAFAGLIALFTLIPAFLAERHRSDATRRQGATNASLSPRLVLPVLAWGGFAAVLVLGVGSLLKSNDMPLTAAVTGLSAPSNSSKQTRSGHRLPPPPQRQSPNVLRGRAHALTGDTLRIANRIFQLADIEAPERDQTCEHANGRSWRCGEAARSALNRLIGRSAITCTIDNIEANGIASGNCTIGDRDIARELVRAGNVFAEAGFLPGYLMLRMKRATIAAGSGTAKPNDPNRSEPQRGKQPRKTHQAPARSRGASTQAKNSTSCHGCAAMKGFVYARLAASDGSAAKLKLANRVGGFPAPLEVAQTPRQANTLPGFKMPSGSKACFIDLIIATPSAPNSFSR